MEDFVRCVFCQTGTEDAVVRRIQAQGLGTAVSPRMVKPMKINGKWADREALLMPGYIFVYGNRETPSQDLWRTDGVIRVLTYHERDRDGYLTGYDLDFALRIRRNQGLWTKLAAIQEGDYVRITEGALREMQGRVVAMNRHRHMAQIELPFLGETRRIWLGYEITEKLPSDAP